MKMMMTMVHQFGFISKIENKEIKAMVIKEFNQQTSHHNCAIDTRRVCVYAEEKGQSGSGRCYLYLSHILLLLDHSSRLGLTV
jgi:hypothetical protein